MKELFREKLKLIPNLNKKDLKLKNILQFFKYHALHSFKKSMLVPAICVIFTFLYVVGVLELFLTYLFSTVIVTLSFISGLTVVLCHGKHRVPPVLKPSKEQIRVSKTLERICLTRNRHYYEHRTVISRQMDRMLQDVLDLITRDYCLSWFRDIGQDETAFVEILNKQVWTMIDNLVERLRNVDVVNFFANEVTNRMCAHFQDLRLSDARQFPGQTSPFLLHPSLKNREAELDYVRNIAESLLICLLPKSDSNFAAGRYILRELFARYIILATADSICDPDYVNQTVELYLEDREKITEAHKPKYAYAETYEEFIKLINVTSSLETLKQIRYHTIAEIMQATVIHNLKGIDRESGAQKSLKQSKRDLLKARNLKRYTNQCRVAKAQCEKRIRLLGGPDYRAYGLGHGQPLENKPRIGKSKSKKNSSKILTFEEIMDNSLARNYLMTFLRRNYSDNLLRFWMAVEQMRTMSSVEMVQLARDVFTVYVTPSAERIVKLDTRYVRGMENFVYGNGGPEFYFEAQKIVYARMEEKYYRDFVLSKHYTEFICQSESAMDELREHLDDKTNIGLDWSDGINMNDRHGFDIWKTAMPSTIEERNDYAVRKLQLLDQALAAKTQAFELNKRAQLEEVQEAEALETEIEVLAAERRQLEFHIERTDLWCEMMGYWNATISNAQLNPEDESSPLFVICVSCDESAENVHDPGALSTGWVVLRQLKDFQNLHSRLKEYSTWMSKELPVPSRKWFKKMNAEALECVRFSLEDYLQILLKDERLSMSEDVYMFLSPSSEHSRIQTNSGQGQDKKSVFALMSSLKESLQNMSFPDMLSDNVEEADEVEPGIEENSQDRKDSIAEPIYTLIGEVFELKGVFKYLRRTLITFVQVSFGGTINRHLREMVHWLISEEMLIYYLQNFKDSMWPNGRLAPPYPIRTDLVLRNHNSGNLHFKEKLRTREKAKELMMKSIPDVLQNLVGKRNSKLGFIKIFDGFQDMRTNKHLFYILMELVLVTVCPEIMSDDVYRSIERTSGIQLPNLTKKLQKDNVEND